MRRRCWPRLPPELTEPVDGNLLTCCRRLSTVAPSVRPTDASSSATSSGLGAASGGLLVAAVRCPATD